MFLYVKIIACILACPFSVIAMEQRNLFQDIEPRDLDMDVCAGIKPPGEYRRVFVAPAKRILDQDHEEAPQHKKRGTLFHIKCIYRSDGHDRCSSSFEGNKRQAVTIKFLEHFLYVHDRSCIDFVTTFLTENAHVQDNQYSISCGDLAKHLKKNSCKSQFTAPTLGRLIERVTKHFYFTWKHNTESFRVMERLFKNTQSDPLSTLLTSGAKDVITDEVQSLVLAFLPENIDSIR